MGSSSDLINEALAKVAGVRAEFVRFCIAALPRLRKMETASRKGLLNECSEHSLREPLQYHYKADLKLAGWTERLNGDQVIAMMAIGLFAHMGERVDLCGALIDMFPEIEVAVRIEAQVRQVLEQEETEAERQRFARAAPLLAATESA